MRENAHPPAAARGAGDSSAGLLVDSVDDLAGSGPLLGVDSGRKRVGVAVSDPQRRVATPLAVLKRGRLRDLVAELRALADSRGAVAIIVGDPLHLSGRAGPSAQSARALARSLAQELGMPVALWDERLSTAAVERQMDQTGGRGKRVRQEVDSHAAAYILQGALDRLAWRDA